MPPLSGTTVSPRLLLIYFGLTAIAIGSALYSFFCPHQVKHYGSAAAYVGGDGPSIGDWAFEAIEEKLRQSSYCKRYMHIRDRFEPDIRVPTSIAEERIYFDEKKRQVHNGILHLHFEQLDNIHLISRIGASVAFLVGFVCLLVPAAQIFLRVSVILLQVAPAYL